MWLCVPLSRGYIESYCSTASVLPEKLDKSSERGVPEDLVCLAKKFGGSYLLVIASPLVNILKVLF